MTQHVNTPSTPAGGAVATDTSTHGVEHHRPRSTRTKTTETKASFKTSELMAYVAAVVAVLIASAVVDVSDFGAQEAWFYVTLLTIGYMVSRGLAKSGSREPYDIDR